MDAIATEPSYLIISPEGSSQLGDLQVYTESDNSCGSDIIPVYTMASTACAGHSRRRSSPQSESCGSGGQWAASLLGCQFQGSKFSKSSEVS